MAELVAGVSVKHLMPFVPLVPQHAAYAAGNHAKPIFRTHDNRVTHQ
jgi:hypothetical protein